MHIRHVGKLHATRVPVVLNAATMMRARDD